MFLTERFLRKLALYTTQPSNTIKLIAAVITAPMANMLERRGDSPLIGCVWILSSSLVRAPAGSRK